MLHSATSAAAALHLASPAHAQQQGKQAAAELELSTTWVATDGFDAQKLINFDQNSYKAMLDDDKRTPLFKEAIRRRLEQDPGNLVVLDLGTGPFAVLALMAARAGAKKVYAIEANADAADRAKSAIAAAKDVPTGLVEVITGLSSDVTLPEKADVILAEIIGSIATEEGVVATVRDAQKRLAKNPFDPNTYIPFACRTYAAPVTYAVHYSLGPPRFDWGKLKEPVRLNCRDETAQLLSDPQLLEEVRLSSEALSEGKWRATPVVRYEISPSRINENMNKFSRELIQERVPQEEAASLAASVAHSLSGVAFWPKLILDPQEELVVDSRGPVGEHAKSHWQTVVALLSSRPVKVSESSSMLVHFDVTVGEAIDDPVRYTLNAKLVG